jgi:hypothetical protein
MKEIILFYQNSTKKQIYNMINLFKYTKMNNIFITLQFKKIP